MQYSVSDFQELIEELNLETRFIDRVYAAWGDMGDDGWEGGFCVKTIDGEYYQLFRNSDLSAAMVTGGKKIRVPYSYKNDYVTSPGDVADWLYDGADPLEAHTY